MDQQDYFLYRGHKTSQISFPLGGIGSGSIGLAGNGTPASMDWAKFWTQRKCVRPTPPSIKYNYIARMGDVYNPCRIYCLNDEGGLVICAWPEGSQKPVIPAPYSQETMNGFEYSAAIHMIMTGMVDEGMECISAIRRRYDGERRNPWNEVECGSNYARSMASYALLNAFSGFEFDMTQGMIGFHPLRATDGFFRCFWSLDSGWGEFVLTPDTAEIVVHYGTLPLRQVHLPHMAERAASGVTVEGMEVDFQQKGARISLIALALLTPQRQLVVKL